MIVTKKQIINTLLVAFSLSLISCGGSDNSGKTVEGTTFSLAKMNSSLPFGSVYSVPLKGSSSDGVNYTGSIERINRKEEMLQGILVTPTDILLDAVSNTLNQSQSFKTTNYTDINRNFISSVNLDGIICTPDSLGKLPLIGKVGDTGIMPTVRCSDNSVYITSWKVTDAGNGTIIYEVTNDEQDINGTPQFRSVDTFNIEQNGIIISIKFVQEKFSNGYIITLESL
ncbi:MAG: hypothetical protein ACC657_16175 [Thiohalomonadales bacterium]